MHPDLVTKFIFNNSVIVEVSSDYVDSVMITVSIKGDDGHTERAFQLETDEIELFASTLNLYKNRIVNGQNKKPLL